MEDFLFKEVCGLPVSFDENITDETKWFALRSKERSRESDFFYFQAGFDLHDGKWVSTILRDENGGFIEYESMKEVVEALYWWYRNNKSHHFRDTVKDWTALLVSNDHPDNE